MEKTENVGAEPVGLRGDKLCLRNRYLVGFRTLENWQAQGIIIGHMEGNKWMFDVHDCDQRLFDHCKTKKPTVSGHSSDGNADKNL